MNTSFHRGSMSYDSTAIDDRGSDEILRYRRIWGAILILSLESVLAVHLARLNHKTIAKDDNTDGRYTIRRGWLGSRDFREVCENAGLSANAVEQRVRRALADEADCVALLDSISSTKGWSRTTTVTRGTA